MARGITLNGHGRQGFAYLSCQSATGKALRPRHHELPDGMNPNNVCKLKNALRSRYGATNLAKMMIMESFVPSQTLNRNGMPSKTVFHTLDGMRGVAAIAVIMLHIRSVFGGYKPEHAYLAVDLFFVMSGFVLAYTYENKLKTGSMSSSQFMTLRFIRLWPLFALSLVISVFGVIIGDRYLTPGGWTNIGLICSFLLSLAFLPAPFTMTDWMYPLNMAGWSLFYELIANAVYSVFFRFCSTRNLYAFAAFCAAGLLFCVVVLSHTGDISGGADLKTAPVGLLRVGFAFSTGILVYRRLSRQSLKPVRNNIAPFVIIASVALCLLLPLPASFNIIFVTLFIAGCPLIVYAAAQYNPSGWLRHVCRFLGETSYGIYVLHVPLGFTIVGVIKKFMPIDAFAPWSGIGLCILLLIITFLLDRYFDMPVRRSLRSGIPGFFRVFTRKLFPL